MKRYLYITATMLFLLYMAGCDQTRPDVIEKLIFSDDDQWLDRDASEDAFELVGDYSCNDYYPYPLPIDTIIYPVINPVGDLDYFALQTTSDKAGWLSVWSKKENVNLRIFSSSLDEYSDFRLGEFFNPNVDLTTPEYWTTLLFLPYNQEHPDTALTILVSGESSSAKGDYKLQWQSIIEDPDLRIEHPSAASRWRRSNWEQVTWAIAIEEQVEAALMKGPVIIQLLGSSDDVIYNEGEPWLDWHIPDNLEPGTDYHLILFHANNPRIMSISDEFEIY